MSWGKTWAVRAVLGNRLEAGGNWRSDWCVDWMVLPSGSKTESGRIWGRTFVVGVAGVIKCPVAPLSRTRDWGFRLVVIV